MRFAQRWNGYLISEKLNKILQAPTKEKNKYAIDETCFYCTKNSYGGKNFAKQEFCLSCWVLFKRAIKAGIYAPLRNKLSDEDKKLFDMIKSDKK